MHKLNDIQRLGNYLGKKVNYPKTENHTRPPLYGLMIKAKVAEKHA
jgi:hypothetical protein